MMEGDVQTPVVLAFNLNGLLVSSSMVFSRVSRMACLSMDGLPSLDTVSRLMGIVLVISC